ncbi:IclR family transcriptional regulator [Kutzneria sp. CA-103260]|uniref:IclR family transcriptional regulator n=1 Tax=Kutzneria sp. CA-103260 TaxID=2802641 RepID=UPI001BAD4E2C|nr:helix-turn-helix domain-containing protein [Kutzneria sp. CA-103260]QUQ66836.1 IclR family transcriptional regulator [Kutzneria sp. CA-103260]
MAELRPHHRAVDRIAEILEAVVTERAGLTLTQLALRLHAPVSSVQKLVNGLVAVGYLEEDGKRFRLGAAPYLLAMRSGQRLVSTVNHSDLVDLFDRTGLSAVLAVRTGDTSVYADWAGTDDPFNYLTVQQLRTPLPETAVGRVLLAYMPDRERHEMVAARYPDDRAAALALLTELSGVRETGYTLGDSGPMLRGIASVAAPVWEQGLVVGAVALAGPHDQAVEKLPEMVDLLLAELRRYARRRVN